MSASLVQWDNLAKSLSGSLHTNAMHRHMYATDASVYREVPLAVAEPLSIQDIQTLVRFANRHKIGLIPRAGGTSLAGQCVGSGIVVDVSKHFNQVLEVNEEEAWVDVQPGVIRDDLNRLLRKHNLFFAPETSTANRAMIGGMVGNNSCGANSIVYGSTRQHVLALDVVLSDGSTATITPQGVEGGELALKIGADMEQLLAQDDLRQAIKREFPKPSVSRRNTGYALDYLVDDCNLLHLLCGSEGTLAFTTRIRLKLQPLPPKHKQLVCVQFDSVDEALCAVKPAMEHALQRCELMDKTIMDCTKGHPQYSNYRFFLEGDPKAVLILELAEHNEEKLAEMAAALIADLRKQKLGYAYPQIKKEEEIKRVWALRKAGLGLLANIPGDAKAVACIEDTAVSIQDLPDFIKDFTKMMAQFEQEAVYYAHAGAGELHLRPILNLKKQNDVELFYDITKQIARLVKQYGGAMSGEHGDGRVRAPFLEDLVGPEVYKAFLEVKRIWDPYNIFNPGKIVHAKPMTEDLRYTPGKQHQEPSTLMRFEDTQGLLRMAEKCNGSGDCRKTAGSGGLMCPSYMASKNEKDTTRARANILREFFSGNQDLSPQDVNQALDLCLSCKGCRSECPSQVDVAAMKAEWMHARHQEEGIPLRHRLFGENARINKLASTFSGMHNALANTKWFKRSMGVHLERSMPMLTKETFRKALKRLAQPKGKTVYFFVDEFTQYYDSDVGLAAVRLLNSLGYRVEVAPNIESGRALISKGLLTRAKQVAEKNVRVLAPLLAENAVLLGLEPSAILSLRDEYKRLVSKDLLPDLSKLNKRTFLLDEWFAKQIEEGQITEEHFHHSTKPILYHGHCHQKSLSNTQATLQILQLIGQAKEIPSGCCGMAGSFGYEKEHYDLSMQIGELVLFPSIRENQEAEICAIGTSCRHQIADGTGKQAKHWVQLLWAHRKV